MLRETLGIAFSPLAMARRLLQNRLNPPVLVLLYHRVTTLDADPQLLAVTPENFRAQMLFLKENFVLARLEDEWSRLEKPAVVVTFDDGYADNTLEALPILEELGVPATFFVATSLIGTDREFWWDEVERVLLAEREYPPLCELPLAEGTRRWPTGKAQDRRRMYHDLLPLLRGSLPETRDQHLERLRIWAGAQPQGRDSHRVLSRHELRRLAASPQVTLGAHTLSHSSLSVLPASRQREEIAGAKSWLEEVLGQEVQVFSYPFGTRGDYTAETVAICRDTGFTRSCSNFHGQWRADTDLQQLPRRIVRNWDLATFKKELFRFWIT